MRFILVCFVIILTLQILASTEFTAAVQKHEKQKRVEQEGLPLVVDSLKRYRMTCYSEGIRQELLKHVARYDNGQLIVEAWDIVKQDSNVIMKVGDRAKIIWFHENFDCDWEEIR